MDANPDQTPSSAPTGLRILIADDDAGALAQLVPALQQESYITVVAEDGLSALRALFAHHPHLVILSLSLPGLNAWTVLERMREVTDIPILVISSKQAVGHRLRAFELHAQDYITKPFHVQEVLLRVRLPLQHSNVVSHDLQTVYDDGILHIDGIRRDVQVNGRSLIVTPGELRLLLLLVRRPGRLVPYADLLDIICGLPGEERESALRSLIHRLRRKLQQAAPGSDYILTQRSLGIRLNVE